MQKFVFVNFLNNNLKFKTKSVHKIYTDYEQLRLILWRIHLCTAALDIPSCLLNDDKLRHVKHVNFVDRFPLLLL